MTDWREELVEKMAKAAWESDGVVNWGGVDEFGRKIYLLEARAALAVAEPVIREQCANDALKRCFFCPADVAAAIREGGKDE